MLNIINIIIAFMYLKSLSCYRILRRVNFFVFKTNQESIELASLFVVNQ